MTAAVERLSLVILAVCALAWPAQAAEGVLIVERTSMGDEVRTNRLQIEPNRIRAEVAGLAGGAQTLIFDGTRQVLWIVNEAAKTYAELTRADVERMSGQMRDMMAMMEEQLKQLPPAQRAQVEAMMKGRGGMALPGGGSAAAIEYRRAGSDRVGGWTCDVYEGYQNGDKVMEVCTVAPGVLGFSDADFAAAGQLAGFFGSVLPQGAETMFRMGSPGPEGFSGVPVRRVVLAGPQTITTEVVEISRQTFAEDLFTVPAGFERQTIPFGAPPR